MVTKTRDWDAAAEANPADTDDASAGAGEIRNLRVDTRERLAAGRPVAGLNVSIDSDGDSNHDMNVTAGFTTDGADEMMFLATALIKQIDAAWAAGTNAGCMDTGAVAASRTYYGWLIKNTSNQTVDFLVSLSVSSPTLPGGYTPKTIISVIVTDASSNLASVKPANRPVMYGNNGELSTLYLKTFTKTAAYTVVSADDGGMLLCSAASTNYAIALPAAATLGDGFTITIKKTDATIYMMTITPDGSETIDLLTDLKLRNLNSTATLVVDGSNWHLVSHSNIVYEYNAIDNASMLVDQYSHVTRSGLSANALLLDRWKFVAAGSASARWTMSVETGGGVNQKSKWQKYLCTTADASPGANEGNYTHQAVIGNNLGEFLGSDGLFENGVFSADFIAHADGASSITFPAKIAVTLYTADGTARQYLSDQSIAADATWQRLSFTIPEDSVADFDPGVTASCNFKISLYGGSGQRGTEGSWATGDNTFVSSSTDNWADATNNYIGFTNVKFQPGQIATPFVPRTNELDICKFYAEKKIYGTTYSPMGSGFIRTTTIAAGYVEWAEKRAIPTVAFSGATTFGVTSGAGSDIQSTGVAAERINKTGCRVKITTGGTFTAGEGCLIANWNNVTAYLFAEADI